MNTLKRVKMTQQKYVKKKKVQVKGASCNPNEISIDRNYMYYLFISYEVSIVSGASMREIEVMRYNKQFLIVIINSLRKVLSEHGYVLKLFLK